MKELGSFVKPTISAEQIVATENYHIHTVENTYIDTMSGLWCTPLGYSNENIKRSIIAQLEVNPFYNNYFETQCDITEHYAQSICEETDMDRVYFSLSGAAAVETAVKLAHHQRPTGKCMVMKRSYHGATVLSGYTSDYNLHEFHKMKSPIEVHYFEGHIPDDMSFILLEPVICAGGIHEHNLETWESIKRYQERGGIVIFDEIVTGFGKTGTMFAKEWVGFDPDIMTLGKAITNGYMPFAATLMKDHIVPKKTFEHGYTCSGHPVASSAAMAALNEFRKIEFDQDYLNARQFDTIRDSLKFKRKMKKLGYIVELSSSDAKRVVCCLPYIMTSDDKKQFMRHWNAEL